ncbi:MAG: metal-dependent transcriptional regulator, partial [Pseudothermotoga sp.]|nr:metal-dependent transcriptional regulator [Pseudothermotoga sp.]
YALQRRIKNFFHYVLGISIDISEKLARHLSHYLTARTRERIKDFYRLIIDFSEDKAKELREFIEESRKLVNAPTLPEEVLEDLKAMEKETEEEEGE